MYNNQIITNTLEFNQTYKLTNYFFAALGTKYFDWEKLKNLKINWRVISQDILNWMIKS